MKPTDPMLQATPPAELALFTELAKQASGFTNDQVVGAAVNLILNVLRQAHPARQGALDNLEQLHTKARGVLAQHYDAMGKRRNVFPFHQVIEMPMYDARPKNGKVN